MKTPIMNTASTPGSIRRAVASMALSAAIVLGLSGCSSMLGLSHDPAERGAIYAPTVRVQPDASWPQVDWQLSLQGISAPRSVDTTRIPVRLQGSELQVYQGVSWAQSSADLVESTLLRTFEDSGRIQAVARSGSGIRSDYKLVLDMRRFESDYAGNPVPSATIEIAAKLMDARDQSVVAAHTFLHAQPASSTDVVAVVQAFEQALAANSRDIVGWTLQHGQAAYLAR